MEVEKKLEQMGLSLPPSATPVANYLPLVRTGNLLFVSGHGPGVLKDGKVTFIQGKLGKDMDAAQGYEAAKHVIDAGLALGGSYHRREPHSQP